MKVEVITIGNELLDGRRADTNTVWIGKELSLLGFSISYRQSVHDILEDIQDALLLAASRADIVITTGGLGPTQDDITFEAVASACNVELEYHKAFFENLKAKYEAKGHILPESNKRQAYLPRFADILHNDLGTAPGCHVKLGKASVYVFPGVPTEMQGLFQASVLPALEKQRGSISLPERLSFSFFGVREAVIEERVLDDFKKLGILSKIDYSITASYPLVHFQFRLGENQRQEIKNQIKTLFFSQYSQYLWHFDEKSIEQHVILKLKERGWFLQTAESTSGGRLTSQLIDVPGCSEVFHQGLVTYSYDSKIKLLGVKRETLENHGAVSHLCALEMAQGLRKLHGADVAVSTTGIAGPTGGTEDKPIGRTYIAWVGPDFEDVAEYTFSGDRERNRIQTTHHALKQLYERIK